jgi:hypothetical protein
MKRWPPWSAPLLGSCGGSIGGLALTGKPHFPFPPVYAALGGAVLGLFAGFVAWLFMWLQGEDYFATDTATSVVARPIHSSRWFGFLLMIAGMSFLMANHALVVTAGKKWFALVCGGSFFVTVGLAGLILPQILTTGVTGQKVPLWGHLVGGILALGGIALGLYLWLVVY